MSARCRARSSRSSARAPARSTRTRRATARIRRRRRCNSHSPSRLRPRAHSRSPSPRPHPPAPHPAAQRTPLRRPRAPASPVTFSADAASAGVCTVSGATVSFVGTGTCTIDANQAGNGSYQAAPQVQQSFPVGLTPQSISFASTPPAGATRRRSGLHRLGHRELRSRRRVLCRSVERRRVHRHGLDRVAHRLGHLHDRREPGRQRHVPGRAAGAAVLLDRRGADRRACSRSTSRPRRRAAR